MKISPIETLQFIAELFPLTIITPPEPPPPLLSSPPPVPKNKISRWFGPIDISTDKWKGRWFGPIWPVKLYGLAVRGAQNYLYYTSLQNIEYDAICRVHFPPRNHWIWLGKHLNRLLLHSIHGWKLFLDKIIFLFEYF